MYSEKQTITQLKGLKEFHSGLFRSQAPIQKRRLARLPTFRVLNTQFSSRRWCFSEISGSEAIQRVTQERHPLQKMEPAPLRCSRPDPKRHSTFPRQRVRVSPRDLAGPGRAGQGERGARDRPSRRPEPARAGSAPRAPALTAAGLRGRRGDRGLAHVSGGGARRGDHAALAVLRSWVRARTEAPALTARPAPSCPPRPSPSPPRGSRCPAGRSRSGGSCPADACHSSMQISRGQG